MTEPAVLPAPPNGQVPQPAGWVPGFVDVAIVMLVAAAVSAVAFARPFELQDEQLVVVYADQLAAGLVPHVDFFTVYGPGTYAVVAAAFHLLGSALEVERLVGLLYHFLIATALMYLARPLGRRVAVIAAAVSLLAMFPLDLIAYAWLGGLALVTWELALLARHRSPRATFTAAFLGALVPLFRPEMIVLSSLCMLPLIWRTGRARWFVMGYLSGLLPLVAYLATAGPALYANIVGSRLAIDGRYPFDDVSGSALVGAMLVTVSTVLLVVIGIRRRDRLWLAAGCLSAAMLPQTYQRLDPDHVAFSACLTVPLAVIAVAQGRVPSDLRLAARATLAGIVALLVIIAMTILAQRPPMMASRVSTGERSTLVAPSETSALRETIAAAAALAPPGSRVFIGTTDMRFTTLSRIGLYHVLPDLRPASYYLELPPAALRPGSGLAQQIESADLLLLSDVDPEANRRLFPNNPEGSDEANQVVRQHFCERQVTPLAHLLVRCR